MLVKVFRVVSIAMTAFWFALAGAGVLVTVARGWTYDLVGAIVCPADTTPRSWTGVTSHRGSVGSQPRLSCESDEGDVDRSVVAFVVLIAAMYPLMLLPALASRRLLDRIPSPWDALRRPRGPHDHH